LVHAPTATHPAFYPWSLCALISLPIYVGMGTNWSSPRFQ